MVARQRLLGPLLIVAAVFGLAGCEPYMSMTDQVPVQTRRATALLPKTPRFVGMVDLETVMKQIDEVSGVDLADSLRQADNPRLRTFLKATGMNPETDLKAVYGAVGEGKAFSAVVFADLTPAQIDRYLDQASGAGRSTTYRGTSVYHLVVGSQEDATADAPDTLSLAFVRSGMIAAATDPGRVQAMIDRHREQATSFRDNKPYMRLVKQVGHGSTAWLVGRNVLQSALRDSTGEPAEGGTTASSRPPLSVGEAGLQHILSQWSDRVLGLSGGSSSFGGRAGHKIERLKDRIREQAVSVTLTDEALEAELYLTMRDEASASNVADIARGVVAALKLSKGEINKLQRDLLDEVRIEQEGPVVHVQFAVNRKRLRRAVQATRTGQSVRRSEASIRRPNEAIRRMIGITRKEGVFEFSQI